LSKIITATKAIKKELNTETISAEREQQLATDLELINLIRENPDILQRYPELLSILEISHQTGVAVSLIERQVAVLRKQNQAKDDRLRELMNIARDNERLARSRHNLTVNLLTAHDLDDVVSIVLAVLTDELAADHAVIKLFSVDKQRIEQCAGLFADVNDEALNAFKTMLQHKNPVCGKSTELQKAFLFNENAHSVKSVAIIPLVAGADLGLIGLGANNKERFESSKATDFLSQIGELISASLAVHLESQSSNA
jgi:hypothetical protein